MVLDGKSSQEYPFLVLHFSYYILLILLTMLSVKLLSMLMILLSILSVIRHLICGNNLNWKFGCPKKYFEEVFDSVDGLWKVKLKYKF